MYDFTHEFLACFHGCLVGLCHPHEFSCMHMYAAWIFPCVRMFLHEYCRHEGNVNCFLACILKTLQLTLAFCLASYFLTTAGTVCMHFMHLDFMASCFACIFEIKVASFDFAVFRECLVVTLRYCL